MAQLSFGGQNSQPASQPQGEKKKFDPIPANEIVPVEVVEVEIRDIPEHIRSQYKIQDKQEVSFHFKVVDGPYKNRHLWGNAKPRWDNSPDCRLRVWTQEILGEDSLPDEYQFDTDTLQGLQARVLVRNRIAKDNSVKDGVGDVMRSLTPTASGVTVTDVEDYF